VGIKHAFQSAKAEGADATKVRTSNWNAEHEIDGPVLFPAVANPSTPGADTAWLYARKMAGRVVPKWMGPSGVDYPLQSSLWGNQIQMWSPASGTTAGQYMGGTLTSAGTVSHPTPSNTSYATRMKRTRWANVVTTTNQVLGIHGSTADMACYLRGNAAGVGGFFLFCRFSVALWPASTVRLFVGLRSGTTAVVASDTLAGHIAGFWHDTTNDATTLRFITRDGTTVNSTSIVVPTLGADVGFDAYIYCPPNGSSIFYRLDRLDTLATIVDSSTSTNLPGNTTFLAPEAAMSNGTANTVVTTTAFACNKLYAEADY
jgi:hypothetical protein